jgi:glycosyltransferase involved in cell wall biosynthesis
MHVEYNCVFNFAASYSGGGYKRLHAYAKWFNENGGALFVINPRCAGLEAQFPNNRFFIAAQSRIRRVFDDCAYLRAIEKEIGIPQLYYSYGIPLYFRFGEVNWFHLSNVLPLHAESIPLSLFDRLKMAYLGKRIRRGFAEADVISAESNNSLSLIGDKFFRKLFLSVNGSDDELAYLQDQSVEEKADVATVLGTQRYKAIDDSFAVFEMLKDKHRKLRLVILGNPQSIPRALRANSNVVMLGILDRYDVIDCLRRSKFFISTTYIENSYNAASEGIFIADESYISDIGPHRELLKGMPCDRVSVPGVSRRLLHVNRAALSGANLKKWDTVVVEMIERFRRTIQER